ncbi:uncharacterized protein LOC142356691, partial [Convolutriloba macropyga]|uniref:uncharacterized protein LOC142356691 n=1 Tax=Convolutriloba macropyga TaxID=536237 RepID=UPI003F5219C0
MASGVFRLYPMSPFGMSKVYDSRLQDWYINTATTSKTVIIALDSSGSVTGSVYKLIRQTAIVLLDTLNDKDFVSIVFFNDQIHPLVVCNEDSDYDNTNTQSPNDVTRDDVTTTTDGYLPGDQVTHVTQGASWTKEGKIKFIQATPRNQEQLKELVWIPFDTRNIANFEHMFKGAYEAFSSEREVRGERYTCSDI